jgi:predicted transcriptional regulator
MSDLDAYHIKLIKKGLRAAEEGKFVSHAEMKKLIARMRRKKKGSSRNACSGDFTSPSS